MGVSFKDNIILKTQVYWASADVVIIVHVM